MTFGDLKNVHWGETIKLLVARGFFSGLVISLVLAANAPPGQGMTWGGMLGFIALWTVGGAFFVMAMGFAMEVVGRILVWTALPGGRLIMLAISIPYWLLALALVAGDPLVWLLIRAAPGLIRVQSFKVFNLTPLIFVMRGAPSFDLGFALPLSWRRGDGLR